VILGDEDGAFFTCRMKPVFPKTRVMLSAYPDREFHRLNIEVETVAFLDKKDLDARTLRQVVEDIFWGRSETKTS
jgi:hypothetical protein